MSDLIENAARPDDIHILSDKDNPNIPEHQEKPGLPKQVNITATATCHNVNKCEGPIGKEEIRLLHTEIIKGVVELQNKFRAAAARKSRENIEELASSRHAAWILAADRKAVADEAVKIPDVVEEAVATRGTKGTLEALYEECKSNNRTLRIALASREAEIRQMTQQAVAARRPRSNLATSAAEMTS